MADKVSVVEALLRLDPQNDDHWTAEGLPRAGALQEIVGRAVSRDEITSADPKFNRAAAAGVTTEKPVEKPVEQAKPAGDQGPMVEGATPLKVDEPKPTMAEVDAKLDALEGNLAEIQAAHDDQSKRVQDARLALEGEQKRLEFINRHLVKAQEDIDRLPRKHRDVQDNLNYIASQNKLRAERHAATAQLRSLGFTAKDLQAKAPIDAAMQRKTARATQRPNFNSAGS